ALTVGVAGVTYPLFPRHLTIISTLTIGVPGFFLALAPGTPLARPGFTRRVLTFTIPAGAAVAGAALAGYAAARAAPGLTAAQVRTAVMLTVFAVGLWVLALVAGRPLLRALVLVGAMAGALVALFAVPAARRVLALQLPPPPVCGALACIVLAAIAALTLWRRLRPARFRAEEQGRRPGDQGR